jgi:hypothetical protein
MIIYSVTVYQCRHAIALVALIVIVLLRIINTFLVLAAAATLDPVLYLALLLVFSQS